MSIADDIMAALNDKPEPVEEVVIPEPEPKPIKSEPKIKLVATEWEEVGTLRSRQAPYSELFNRKVEDMFVPDHLVWQYEGYGSFEPIENYVFDWEVFDWFSWCVHMGKYPLLHGPTGCGKTLCPEQFAALTGRPVLRVELNEEFDKAVGFGTMQITNGDTTFLPGDIPTSAAEPTLVILDEIFKASANVAFCLKRIMDRKEIYLPEMKEVELKAIKPHAQWFVCGTDNSLGDGEDLDKYPTCNVQDAAFRNAWSASLPCDYLSEENERQYIAGICPDMPSTTVNQLAKFSSMLHIGFKESKINTAFSMRQLATIGKHYNGGIPLDKAIQKTYIAFCAKSEMTDVQETYRAVFG